MNKILCFGELLLRFSPGLNGQWLRSGEIPVHLGGAELNVATALGRWNLPVLYYTALPDHYLSKDILEILKERKLAIDHILFSGDRIGSYYLSQGTDLKNHSVIYDREHSAFSDLTTGMIDWDLVLQDISWLHFSAISPALSDSIAAVCLEMLQAASKKNITISIDLNYRPKLWKQRNPQDVMSELMNFCDVVMGNIWSAHDLLDVPLDQHLISAKDKTAYLEHAHYTAVQIQKRFERVKTVAITFRFEEGERGVLYYGSLFSAQRQYDSLLYRSEKIYDKVGTGDCFMAGLIYGLHKQLPEQEIIEIATSAGFGKFFEVGDSTRQELDTVLARIHEYE